MSDYHAKRICFIAQFPPPIHGLSKAVETLYNSELSEEFVFERIDITRNIHIISNLVRILRSKADLFYFTISQTKGGNLRDLIILKLIELKRTKCIVHLHGGYYRQLVEEQLAKWQRVANYRRMAKLEGAIVLGPSLKYIFQGMLPEERIFTVANCVDDEYILGEGEFQKKIRTITERKVKHVLFLSNFIKSKGYPLLLEMAKEEKKRVEAGEEKLYHFDFAGFFFSKEEEKNFLDFIRDNSIENYVTYHGAVNGEAKRELLKQDDIFVLLTRYPKEGQPISILEAMANGMAIVTTDHAGIPDIVQDKKNGAIIPKEFTIKQIYDLLDKIANNVSIRCENYARCRNEFSEEQYIQSMREVYKRALQEKKRK